MLLLIAIFTFASISFAVWELLRPKPDTVQRRIGGGRPLPSTRDERLQGSIWHRLVAPNARALGGLLKELLPQNFVRRIEQMLTMANNPWPLAGFLLVWAMFAAGGILLWIYVTTSGSGMTPARSFAMGLAILPFAVLVPYMVLRRRVKNRQKQIRLALPDALDLLVTCVEAGVGVDSAFALVAEKSEGPLAESLALYLRQVGFGRSRRDALDYVAARTGLPDLIDLSAAVSQAEDLGTSLGDVLRVQAEELRLKRRQRAQEAAQRAPVLMTIPLALCFLPAMGAVVVVPSILNLIDFAGNLGN